MRRRSPFLDDPGPSGSYIGPVFTEAQVQYLEEVLGTSAANFRFVGLVDRAPDSAPAQPIELMVLTNALSDDERALLEKILGSVKIANYQLFEQEIIEPGHTPQGILPKHVIAFTEHGRGRSSHDEVTWWCLPPLEKMLGATAEVAAAKKEAWNLLQQFARVRG